MAQKMAEQLIKVFSVKCDLPRNDYVNVGGGRRKKEKVEEIGPCNIS